MENAPRLLISAFSLGHAANNEDVVHDRRTTHLFFPGLEQPHEQRETVGPVILGLGKLHLVRRIMGDADPEVIRLHLPIPCPDHS